MFAKRTLFIRAERASRRSLLCLLMPSLAFSGRRKGLWRPEGKTLERVGKHYCKGTR